MAEGELKFPDTQDCSEGRRTQAALAEERNKFQAIINAMQEAVIYADQHGLVVEMNDYAEKLLNVKKREVLGKSIIELHPPEIRERIKSLIEEFQSNPDQDLQTISRQLGERWLEMRFSALRDKEGRFQGVIANQIDVTEKKRLEEKQRSLGINLIQEHKLSAIGILASGIAHNLNGPLAVIVGYLDLLYSRYPELVEIPLILSQTERMKEIIRNMMIKSRHEQDTQKRPVDLNSLLQNELRFLEANLDFKHKIDKQYEFATGLPLIEGVYSDFSQSFLNIINNAIDAMVDSPIKNLLIKTHYDSENIFLEIQDTGCGLDTEDVDKLFSPFYSTKPPVGEGEPGRPTGTGLGLSSAYQLISKYGGTIKVEGKPGEGTRFTIVIPIERNRPGSQNSSPFILMEETENLVEVPA